MYVLTPNEYNLDLHIPKKRKDWKIIFFHIWKRRIWVLYLRIIGFNFIISTNSVWQCQQMREKSLWSDTTTTSHGNRKCELNWLPFLKIEPWAFFLPNTMLAAIFIKFFGGKCSFWSWLLKMRKDLCRVAYFCWTYIYIPPFGEITSMPSSSFDIFCFEFQHAWNWHFFFSKKKKEFILPLFLFSLSRNHQILKQVGTIILWKNNMRVHRADFAAFSCATRNWWEKPCISHVVKYTIRWESDGRKVPICWGEKWVPIAHGETHIFHIL